ncbi:MAG: hypothetical protein J4452_00885 [Candidatus Aenigmarchaeota archaeon]|nr:hypothetical protein [Candidatus Aenigmarchaeota archaeon]
MFYSEDSKGIVWEILFPRTAPRLYGPEGVLIVTEQQTNEKFRDNSLPFQRKRLPGEPLEYEVNPEKHVKYPDVWVRQRLEEYKRKDPDFPIHPGYNMRVVDEDWLSDESLLILFADRTDYGEVMTTEAYFGPKRETFLPRRAMSSSWGADSFVVTNDNHFIYSVRQDNLRTYAGTKSAITGGPRGEVDVSRILDQPQLEDRSVELFKDIKEKTAKNLAIDEDLITDCKLMCHVNNQMLFFTYGNILVKVDVSAREILKRKPEIVKLGKCKSVGALHLDEKSLAKFIIGSHKLPRGSSVYRDDMSGNLPGSIEAGYVMLGKHSFMDNPRWPLEYLPHVRKLDLRSQIKTF